MGTEAESRPVRRYPSLLLANHPFANLLWPILGLGSEYYPMRVVCDAALSGFLRVVGVASLGIDPKSRPIVGSEFEELRMRLLRMLGGLSGAYSEALREDQAVRAMMEVLKGGESLLMFPTGVSDPKARWRSGAGRLVREIIAEKMPAGLVFVNIGRGLLPRYRAEKLGAVGSLQWLSSAAEGALSSRQLSQVLEREYGRIFEDGVVCK